MREEVCRIGGVRFLNARPLLWGLESALPRCKIIYDVPSALADRLAADELDVALIPVAAYLEGVGGEIVPGVSIACAGPVGTIKLFSRCRLEDIRTLALDQGSRSSALLARAALSVRYGVRPKCIEVEPDLRRMLAQADAALVIGRADLLTGKEPVGATTAIDLGDLWWSWQGVPLVLALWAFRRGWSDYSVAPALQEARDRGLAAVSEIAEVEADHFGIESRLIVRYLSEMLDFSLSREHIEGIRRYRDLLLSEGLLPSKRELSFVQ